MDIWQNQFSEYLIHFIKNPGDVANIEKIYYLFSKNIRFQKTLENKLFSHLEFKKLYDQWYKPEKILLDELLQLPKNTLGYKYAYHMKTMNLKTDFINEFPEKNILSYLWLRAQSVHDIGHLITGFDTSFIGEIKLKGFELAQYQSPSTSVILSAGLLSLSCLMPEKIDEIYSAFFEGYQLGQKNPLLISIVWEKEFQTDFNEVIAKHGLVISSK